MKRYTWRQPTPLKMSRLDFFLISEELLNFTTSTDILPGYRTDHSIVTAQFSLNDLPKGKSYWKFNNSLLKDIDYINMVKGTMNEVIKQYAATSYNPDRISDIHPRDLNILISDNLFFEALLLEIRGKTI